jgi:hypothetical protein
MFGMFGIFAELQREKLVARGNADLHVPRMP